MLHPPELLTGHSICMHKRLAPSLYLPHYPADSVHPSSAHQHDNHACRYGHTHMQARIASWAGNHHKAAALWRAQHKRGALQLHAMLERLQGFYLKLGQLLASKADVLPPVYTAALSPLLDDLPAGAQHNVQKLLRKQLRKPVGEVCFLS